jgi:hypothetical protein
MSRLAHHDEESCHEQLPSVLGTVLEPLAIFRFSPATQVSLPKFSLDRQGDGPRGSPTLACALTAEDIALSGSPTSSPKNSIG